MNATRGAQTLMFSLLAAGSASGCVEDEMVVTQLEPVRIQTGSPSGPGLRLEGLRLGDKVPEAHGEPVTLNHVLVTRRVGQGAWVSHEGRPAPHIYVAGDLPDPIARGDRLTITGTMRRTPPLQVVKDQWALYGPALMRVAERGHYVEVKSVRRAQRNGNGPGQENGPERESASRKARRDRPPTVAALIRGAGDGAGQMVFLEDLRVDQVISDRAFWLMPEDAPQGSPRFLGIVREDVPRHEMIDIDAGHRMACSGLALPADQSQRLTGTLDPDTQRALDTVPAFVAMHWKDVHLRDP